MSQTQPPDEWTPNDEVQRSDGGDPNEGVLEDAARHDEVPVEVKPGQGSDFNPGSGIFLEQPGGAPVERPEVNPEEEPEP